MYIHKNRNTIYFTLNKCLVVVTYCATFLEKTLNVSAYIIMKTMCSPGYLHNGFVATHALGQMMYGYTLLVPLNQRVLNKQSKERNISDHK